MIRRAEIEITPEIDEWADEMLVLPAHFGAAMVARQIVASRPRPIEAGVRVKDCDGYVGTVIAVHADRAWIAMDGAEAPMVYRAGELEVLP